MNRSNCYFQSQSIVSYHKSKFDPHFSLVSLFAAWGVSLYEDEVGHKFYNISISLSDNFKSLTNNVLICKLEISFKGE